MTSTRYIVERFAQAFGYQRKAHRLNDAASEMHLLREAEAHLGEAIWRNIENIEDLSTEYWSLRKMAHKQGELHKQIEICQQRLEDAHNERDSLLMEYSVEEDPELVERRTELLNKLEELTKERDAVINEGRLVRKHYNGIKTKLEVIVSEGERDEDEIQKVKDQLEELKNRFNALKEQRDAIAAVIAEGDDQLDLINQKIQEIAQRGQEIASEAFKIINQANKEVWQLRAESGLIDTRMHQLQAEIGRYISRHALHDSACAAAAKSHQGLIDVMRALRRSIALNHKLAGTI